MRSIGKLYWEKLFSKWFTYEDKKPAVKERGKPCKGGEEQVQEGVAKLPVVLAVRVRP